MINDTCRLSLAWIGFQKLRPKLNENQIVLNYLVLQNLALFTALF